jgi:hypothetical protein
MFPFEGKSTNITNSETEKTTTRKFPSQICVSPREQKKSVKACDKEFQITWCFGKD